MFAAGTNVQTGEEVGIKLVSSVMSMLFIVLCLNLSL